MKKLCLTLLLSFSAVSCGTGQEDDRLVPDQSRGAPIPIPAASAVPTSVPTPVAISAVLRLGGVNGSGSVLVRVASVEMTIDGHAIPAALSGGEIDLASESAAPVVATFELPADAGDVGIKLRFVDIGTVERDGKTLVLDLRGPPISVVSSAAQVRAGSKVVIELDLARSIVELDGQLVLMPQFTVRY